MGKVIYSIFEIEKKSNLLNIERELKKDWLSKSMELLSSKTVLKDIKQGEVELKKADETNEEFEKLIFLQEALAYFYMGNFRANGKDRRVAKGLEETIEKYHALLINYFLDIYKKVEMYEINYDILEEMSIALREGNNRVDVKEILSEYEKNKIAFDFYKELMSLKENSIELIRKKYKELIAGETSEFIINLKNRFNEEFKKANEFLTEISQKSELIKNADRIDIQNKLKLISYFNSNIYTRQKNIIFKYFNLIKIRNYFENEYTYSDYKGIEMIYKIFEIIKKLEEKNQLIIEEETKLKKIILKYSDAFIFYNFNLFFDFNREDYYIENLFLVEKFIKNIENPDRIIISHMTLLKELREPEEKQKKLEQIINLVEISDVSFRSELLKRLLFLHHKNKENLRIGDSFRVIFKDLEKKINYHFIKKDEIELGRSRSNEIRVNTKYISRKHLKIECKNEVLVNYKKENENKLTYINNNGREVIDRKSFLYDDINEINIGNLFTYKVINNENFIFFIPFLEKCNRIFISEFEMDNFLMNRYIIIKKESRYFLNLQDEEVYIKDRRNNKNDVKIEINNWVSVKIGNDFENTLQLGENNIDENFRILFEKI